jgi:predicted small lipoprotein YifL
MKTISRAITITLSAGIFVTMFVSKASACGEVPKGPFEFPEAASDSRVLSASANAETALARGSSSVPIAGMWKFQLISKGNTTHNPSIPDGALIDFGFTQWHSDGTEIQNSAGVPGGGFCLGVWGQTGFLTFELNHFPIAFNPTTGKVANYKTSSNRTRYLPAETASLALLPRTSTTPQETRWTTSREP